MDGGKAKGLNDIGIYIVDKTFCLSPVHIYHNINKHDTNRQNMNMNIEVSFIKYSPQIKHTI